MTTTQRDTTKERLRRALPWLLLVVVVAAGFWRAPFLGYVLYDDKQYLDENAIVNQGLSLEAVQDAFTRIYASNWHPLTWISHQVDVSLFGFDPAGHHVHNVLLHLATTLLLFAFFRLATRQRFPSPWPAFFVAAIFAVHPLRVESVMWMAERKDVLSGVFWALCMLLYYVYARRPGLWRYLALFGSMAVGLMAKPMLVTLPVALLLLDFWPLGRMSLAPEGAAPRDSWKRILLEKLPLLALAAASSWVTMIAQQTAMGTLEHLSVVLRIGNALQSYIFYLVKTFWPVDLIPYYPHAATSLSWWVSGICAAAMVAITVAVLVLRRRAPWLLTGWGWHLATLVPVIGLVQVGGQAMADRYTYIPGIGVAAAVVYSAAALARRHKDRRFVQPAAVALGLVLVLALTMATQRQSARWQDAESLFTWTISIAPSDLAHNNLANAYAQKGENEKALHNFLEALKQNPANYISAYNAGQLYKRTGKPEKAAEMLQHALRLKPDLHQAHTSLGEVYLELGQPEQASVHFQYALRKAPREIRYMLLNHLGVALAQQGNVTGARQAFQRALRMQPESKEIRLNLEKLSKPRIPANQGG